MDDMIQDPVLTIDVDWAPDWMIEEMAAVLIDREVRATWFVTHDSAAIGDLRKRKDLFEVGIHPNFLPGSTHGGNEDQVMSCVMSIAPDAVSMRTHALYQTSPMLVSAAKNYGIRYDVSLFLPRTPNLQPCPFKLQGARMWRIPYSWEDDSEMFEEDPIWTVKDPRLEVPGIRIFDFHPVYTALNIVDFSVYESMKEIAPVPSWSRDFAEKYSNHGEGPATFFDELTDRLSGKGRWVREIVGEE